MKYFIFWKVISVLLSEVAFAFYLTLIFSFYGSLGNMSMMQNILIGTLFMVVIPISAIIVLYREVILKMGLIERDKRPKFYLINIISYAIVSYIFNYFGNGMMLKVSLSFLLIMFIFFWINFKWKISLHAAGLGIASTILFLKFGSIWLLLFALTPFVYWLRLKLKAHNINQLLAGSFLSILVTYFIFTNI